MVTDSQFTEERLLAVCTMMRGLVESSIRQGMLRAVPDPMEARQLATVHMRLLQRIRSMEVALHEFQADLQRADALFERAETRVNGPSFLTTKDPEAACQEQVA